MRKLFVFMMVSLDGYFERPNHELDWHNVDSEFNEFAIAQLDEADTLLFGRVTYTMMADFWPSKAVVADDPIVAGKMNSMKKVVFSTTLKNASWDPTTVIHDNVRREVLKLKEGHGKDLAILGSSHLTVSLAEMGLVDELRVMINPVILGKGNIVFEGLHTKLKLTDNRTFVSGNVLLTYQPVK